MIYICKRCNYETNKISNLKKHINRKYICNDINNSNFCKEKLLNELNKNYICDYCDEKFETSDKKYKHKKVCKENNNTKLLEKINELEERLRNQEQKNITSIQNIITNNNTTYNTINNTINLNNFGEENLSHITYDDFTKFSSSLNKGITDFIENTHFNKDVKENMNIRLKTNDIIEVVNKGRWIEKDFSNTIDDMISKGRKVLFRHFIENKEKEERLNDLSEILRDYFIGLGNLSNDYHKLKRDLFFVIKNNTVYLMEDIINE
jgi:anion-transporting  ArsA/GET3 family ATPase